VDFRRWWLLAAIVPVLVACAVAVGDPALSLVGDLGVVVAGLTAAAVLWVVGGRLPQRRSWRLLAAAPLLPVLGTLLSGVVDPAGPLKLVVLRWVPTVPGYLIAIAAALMFLIVVQQLTERHNHAVMLASKGRLGDPEDQAT
jgi:hypothetical protein